MNSIIGKGTKKSYLLGFVFSLILTLLAYLAAKMSLLSGVALYSAVGFLALLQAWIQLSIFLNLGKEGKPHWNLIMFLFTVAVTLIIVLLSLWIMNELNYNLMPP
jgi:cytochrome o ubiquinol oxidase operon protein cyoD